VCSCDRAGPSEEPLRRPIDHRGFPQPWIGGFLLCYVGKAGQTEEIRLSPIVGRHRGRCRDRTRRSRRRTQCPVSPCHPVPGDASWRVLRGASLRSTASGRVCTARQSSAPLAHFPRPLRARPLHRRVRLLVRCMIASAAGSPTPEPHRFCGVSLKQHAGPADRSIRTRETCQRPGGRLHIVYSGAAECHDRCGSPGCRAGSVDIGTTTSRSRECVSGNALPQAPS
jgi:hypothetical protein